DNPGLPAFSLAPLPKREGFLLVCRSGACRSARWRGQLARVEVAVAVGVLADEPLGQAAAVFLEADRLALADGLLLRGEDAVAIAVHALEGIAHPGHVLVLRNPAVAVGVHARQVVGGTLDLGDGAAGDRQQPA